MITPEEPLRLETVGVLRNGRRRYDPASKQRLVEACLQPGVSLAGLALQHGVNANLLRKWVAKRQLQNGDGQPYAWLRHALTELPQRAPDADIEDLLPFNCTAQKNLPADNDSG